MNILGENAVSIYYISTVKMEAESSSETLVTSCETI